MPAVRDVSKISGYDETEKILKALASQSRLQILEWMQTGVTNPDEIARRLERSRSTTEQHLKVLQAAKILRKVPLSSKGDQQTIFYEIPENARELLVLIQNACRNFKAEG